jgi:ABC-type sugar transport system ATPase subunit
MFAHTTFMSARPCRTPFRRRAGSLPLDEPTAALGVAQTAQVLNLVRRLADRGLAVVLISHNMSDVLQVADSIVVMFLGRTAAHVRRSDVNQQQLVELITTGQLSQGEDLRDRGVPA